VVADGGQIAVIHEAYRIVGTPRFGGILVVSDHASNRVPEGVDLGIPPELLDEHIAIDIGVGAIGAMMAESPGIAAFQGNVSRLVCDFNRDEEAPAVVPLASDGHPIPGNFAHDGVRDERISAYYGPYHNALAALLEEIPQALILSLHSFTPRLESDPEQLRPWQVGVLYNHDERPARIAIPMLAAEGLVVGDNEPYSGKLLNATMNRHAEADGRPYLGIEVRQDQIGHAAGQAEWAERLVRLCNRVAVEIG
jgi:predicted N-formylglutamate amidohydrolase